MLHFNYSIINFTMNFFKFMDIVNYDNEFDKLSDSKYWYSNKGYQSSSSDSCPY